MVIAAAAAAWAVFVANDAEPDSPCSITVSGHNEGPINANCEEFTDEVSSGTLREARDAARKYADVPPPRSGPSPFLIAGAPHGLKVRTSGTVDGVQIGAVINQSVVWGECQTRTDFDPDRTDNTGAAWLRIKWGTNQPNAQVGFSEPSGKYSGWVYMGFTVPAGHNGAVRSC
ncbi:hypothetical protein [Cryptosporangium phraense]|uniref:Uncharacterized protein n=1 Tax=Cryptosporangium phraense TaxID=2593070 RepID=A0A545AMS2_9ACTN|nr:hypothetical protein [Cryptosporangium phraense]TQS42561.1 hypothetical protein FL583_22980 [Cryptosporangium phraense]